MEINPRSVDRTHLMQQLRRERLDADRIDYEERALQLDDTICLVNRTPGNTVGEIADHLVAESQAPVRSEGRKFWGTCLATGLGLGLTAVNPLLGVAVGGVGLAKATYHALKSSDIQTRTQATVDDLVQHAQQAVAFETARGPLAVLD